MCRPAPTCPSRGGLAGVRPALPLRRGLAPASVSEAPRPVLPSELRRVLPLPDELPLPGELPLVASVLRKKKDILIFVQFFF